MNAGEITRKCPVCGGWMLECRDIVAVGKQSMFGDFYIKCYDGLCGVETDRYEISEEGIDAWNNGKLKWKRQNAR